MAGSLSRTAYGLGRGAVTYVSAVAASPPSLPDPFQDGPFEPTSVGGGDPDPRLAEVKCFPEAAEFLVSGAALPADAVHRPATDLAEPWLPPDELISYQADHRARLGVETFDAGEPQWWVPAQRAGRRVWLPAALIVGRVSLQPNWFTGTAVSSSGVAAHPIWQQAIRAAWLEGVERDAFQRRRVLAGVSPPASVKLSSIPRPNAKSSEP